MKKIIIFALALSFFSFYSCNRSKVDYPETNQDEQIDDYFGVKISDPYRWLEDDNAPETETWVEAQNKVTFDYLATIPYREKVKNRLTEIWNYERKSAPFKKGDYYFYSKNDGLQNQSVLYYTKDLKEEGNILLNPNELSKDGTVALANYAISKNGEYFAYAIARGGSDWQEIYIKNIASGKNLEDHIEWVKFSNIAWYKDGFYYSRYDAPKAGEELSKVNEFHKVYYHKLGDVQEDDKLIYHNKTYPKRNVNASLTPNEKYLIIQETESTHGNTLVIKNLSQKNAQYVQITTGFEYSYEVIDDINDHLIVLTNYKAPKYKLVSINVKSNDVGNWKDIIPEKKEVLNNVDIVGGKILATYIKDAHSKVDIYDVKGGFEGELELPTLGTVRGFKGSLESKEAFYTFTSYTFPSLVYRLNLEDNTSSEFFKPNIDFDFNKYKVDQIFYKSKDGIDIPMFIVSKKDVVLNGNNPTILYGYGGFNASLTPYFKAKNLVWLENGGVYCVANIRGGGEYGENWHRAGTKLNKQNVFDDFIAAAEYLINNKYTSPKKLAINGGSNGGLLVGAVTNQRPDLFAVAVPQVGVMDMLRFHKFTIGWAWVGDYGSSEDSIHFANLLSYSPLHNISDRINYPAILVTTADHDDRVVPAHSFKYISTMQEKYNGKHPTIIRIQTKAGHGAGMPTSLKIEEATDIFSFIWYNMDVVPIYE